MLIANSANAKALPVDSATRAAMETIAPKSLRRTVEVIAVPRHYQLEPKNNQMVAQWIFDRFEALGFAVERQGPHDNIVAVSKSARREPQMIIGAHYDSVPRSPGADDNASAVAAMLGVAEAVANARPDHCICFVAFNREEDGLLGSVDFVATSPSFDRRTIREAHILEMVGYCSHMANSQRVPPKLPVRIPHTGNFLGLIGNSASNHLVTQLLQQARGSNPVFPVVGLKVMLGLEKHFSSLTRSDHAPFWIAGIPTLMWTDTSEFRNPNYHQITDTPDTLDYEFMANVTRLLVVRALTASG
ncbi:MAG: Zn-dependent M28 family amino/carboxypeptidase [Rhodothermales bacterium]|jgi:Zn-dependent M28 family amino/carboxypeptidase